MGEHNIVLPLLRIKITCEPKSNELKQEPNNVKQQRYQFKQQPILVSTILTKVCHTVCANGVVGVDVHLHGKRDGEAVVVVCDVQRHGLNITAKRVAMAISGARARLNNAICRVPTIGPPVVERQGNNDCKYQFSKSVENN